MIHTKKFLNNKLIRNLLDIILRQLRLIKHLLVGHILAGSRLSLLLLSIWNGLVPQSFIISYVLPYNRLF